MVMLEEFVDRRTVEVPGARHGEENRGVTKNHKV